MTSVEREVFAREEARELKERVIEINRVAKVVKGGRRFSFTALVVIGDEVDRVGVGYGKAREVPLAITKAVDDAKKNLFAVPKHGTTITHESLGSVRRSARAVAAGERGNRRHRRRRRSRRPRARGHPRHPREEPRHDESDQHGEGDRERVAAAAPAGGSRADARPADLARAAVQGAAGGARGSAASPSRAAVEVSPGPATRTTSSSGRRRGAERARGRSRAPARAQGRGACGSRGGAAVPKLKVTQVRSQIGNPSAIAARFARSASARSAARPSTRKARCSPVC